MKIEGTYTFAASRDIVWPMLMDPEVLSKVMPGCEKLEQVEENKYTGILKIRIGPVQGKFNGTITLSDIQAPESYYIEVNGKGPAGIINGQGRLNLAEEGQETVMAYDGEAQVNGRIAQVGQRLLDTSAKAIIRQSLDGLDQQVQSRVQGANGTADTDGIPATAPSIEAPSQSEFALGVAKNFVEELIPPDQQPEVIKKGLVLVGVLLLFRMVGNWWINRIARRVAKILRED